MAKAADVVFPLEVSKGSGFVKSFYTQKSGAIPTEEVETLEVPTFNNGEEPARVSMSSEYTRQIKQYEPLKISVFVSVPCAANEKEMIAALGMCEDIMSKKLAEGKASIDAICGGGQK